MWYLFPRGWTLRKTVISSFEAFWEAGKSFDESLESRGIRHLFIGGLATDYCVKYTVLEALRKGFSVTLLIDAVRGVDLKPGDSESAIREMVLAGALVACLGSFGVWKRRVEDSLGAANRRSQ